MLMRILSGGVLVLIAAREDPSRIRELVLVGSVGPRIEAAFRARAFHPAPVPPEAETVFAANFARPPTVESIRSEGRDLGVTADLDPSRIDRPILIVQGDEDLLVPLFVAEEIHRRAPRSELRSVPGGGHAIPVTRPGELADWIVGGAGGGS